MCTFYITHTISSHVCSISSTQDLFIEHKMSDQSKISTQLVLCTLYILWCYRHRLIVNFYYMHIIIIHSLGGNSMGDDRLHALSLPIKNYCKELKEVTLVNTSFPFTIKLAISTLKILRLENFSDNNNYYLYYYCFYFITLYIYRLWRAQLTDRSITCLTEWIKVLNNLEKLNLR